MHITLHLSESEGHKLNALSSHSSDASECVMLPALKKSTHSPTLEKKVKFFGFWDSTRKGSIKCKIKA